MHEYSFEKLVVWQKARDYQLKEIGEFGKR